MPENSIFNDLERIFAKLSITALNEIQNKTIEVFDKGHDVLLIAPTGSGKTLAFLMPVMHQIVKLNQRAIIIAPTRELVLQIAGVAKNMAMGIKVNVCYGGHSMRDETNSLGGGYQLVVGTPGRLADHVRKSHILAEDFLYCVLDEFDKSLEIGFHDEMMELSEGLINVNQFILTSATEATPIPSFIPVKNLFSIKEQNDNIKPRLMQWQVISPAKDKLETLLSLVQNLLPGSMIIFCNFKESVERVHHFLTDNKIENDFFHGGLDQLEREITLSKFRNGTVQILVSTDLAARGLDITVVENIIHYHFSFHEEEFIHRNGRTARMGATGNSYLLKHEFEDLPAYMTEIPNIFYLKNLSEKSNEANWKTIKLNRGSFDKMSKSDVLGFICKNFDLEKNDVGQIEIKDKFTLVAVKVSALLNLDLSQTMTIKGKSVKLATI